MTHAACHKARTSITGDCSKRIHPAPRSPLTSTHSRSMPLAGTTLDSRPVRVPNHTTLTPRSSSDPATANAGIYMTPGSTSHHHQGLHSETGLARRLLRSIENSKPMAKQLATMLLPPALIRGMVKPFVGTTPKLTPRCTIICIAQQQTHTLCNPSREKITTNRCTAGNLEYPPQQYTIQDN